MLTAEQRVLEIFRSYTDREGQPPLLKAMSLEAVLRDPRLWRCGRALPIEAETIPSGFAEIDALLPGAGWPRGALTEILTDIEGLGALRLAPRRAEAWASCFALSQPAVRPRPRPCV